MSAALAGPSAAFVDFEAALGQLNADDDPRSGPWAWLEAAYADPEGYEAALFAHAARALGVGSERGVAYDFFADLCGRRIDPRAVAIRARRGGTAGLEAVGYRELEARSRVLGGALRRAGVQPGDAVALCHRDFIDDAVARLAVLRCGAVLCPIAPRGRSQVRHELEVLAPPYLICCDISALWLEGLAVVRVRAEASDDAALPAGASTAYGAGAAVLRMVSRYDGSQRQVVEVTAHRLFVGLLSTALLLLDTPRCRSVAFPGAEGDTELLVSAATWLGGGTYVHASLAALADDPELLVRTSVDVLGANAALRDTLLSGRLRPPKVALWIHDPSAAFDWDPWDRFGQLLAADGARGAGACFSLALGGPSFVSPKRKRPHLLEVFPPPGRPFMLADLLGAGTESEGPSGVYSVTDLGKDSPLYTGRFLLARDGARIMLSGSLDGTPYGRPYPAAAIERAAVVAGGLRGALVLTRPAAGRINGASLVLLAFLDVLRADGGGHERTRRELEDGLRLALGEDALPSRVEVVALEPRLSGGVVDGHWGEAQWSDGLLRRKASSEAFGALARVRRIVAGLVQES